LIELCHRDVYTKSYTHTALALFSLILMVYLLENCIGSFLNSIAIALNSKITPTGFVLLCGKSWNLLFD